MSGLDALFADLLADGDTTPTGNPGDIGDNGDKQALARPAAGSSAGDMLATSGDISPPPLPVSPNVARVSPGQNGPQTRMNAHLSPMSPMSPAQRVETASDGGCGNPLMTAEQADACHAGGWDDAEIQTFTVRVLTFFRRGIAAEEADDIAERLTLRDREADERRMCLECAALDRRGRCLVAARGALPGVDRRFEPVPTLLQRCEGFELRKDLT